MPINWKPWSHADAGRADSSERVGFAGHAKQEAREIVDALAKYEPGEAVLVPAPDTATGWRAMALAERHRDGMAVDKQPAGSGPPNAALFSALGEVEDRRTVLIPELFSKAAGRNVRFAVILPPGFDKNRTKPYDLITLVPEPPPGSTLAMQLKEKDLLGRVGEQLGKQKVSDAIVILPERFEHRSGAEPKELERLARAVLDEDLVPWVSGRFNAESEALGTFRLPSWSDVPSTPSSDPVRAPPPPASDHFSGGSWFSSSSLGSKLQKDPAGVLAPDRHGEYSVQKGEDLSEALGKIDGPVKPPERSVLRRLADAGRAVMATPAIQSATTGQLTPYGVITPPGYDPERSQPYAVRVVVPPPGASFASVVKALGAGGPPAVDGTVLIVPKPAASRQTTRALAESELLDQLGDYRLDLNRYSVQDLGPDASAWKSEIQSKTGERRRPAAPIVSVDGKWQLETPTRNYQKAFPEPSHFGGTERIPTELQKQPANQGAFFAPVIDSQAIGERIRCGVYLPPGYDPNSAEKYPVLVLLPGKGNPLHYWTSAGQIIPKLDQLMSGDAQKMIVVIPGNTDSFWFDYDQSGHATFGKEGKRDFEGLVMKELLGYATKELHGDPKNLAIGGISRGGFGAMSLALRHPGTFKSVSSHAGVLALEHQGTLDPKGSGSVEAHFGPADDPIWAATNPLDLVQKGGFSAGAPRIFLDVGNQDPLTKKDALAFAEALTAEGVDHRLAVLDRPGKELKHSWDAWAPALEGWVAFHQASFGKAGAVSPMDGVTDVSEQAIGELRAAEQARREKIATNLADVKSRAPGVAEAAEALLPRLGGFLPFEPMASARGAIGGIPDRTSALVEEAASLGAALAKGKLSSGAAEERSDRLVRQLKEHSGQIERTAGDLERYDLGVRPSQPTPNPAALDGLGFSDRADLKAVIAAVPETLDAILLLAALRPQVLETDKVTGQRFAAQLRSFVEHHLDPEEAQGLGEMIRRVAVRRFDWRRGGYSHSVCTAMNTVYNHPGLILDLIAAAKEDRPYKVKGVYSGDGQRSLRPLEDFRDGLRSMGSKGDLPGAELGYERGFLRAIRDELAPSPQSLPKDRFASLCDPVAVGLSKLVGEEIHYGYAFNLKTGADLVAAVASQKGEGLAMADVEVKIPGKASRHLHFPVFYDYDPKTKTIAMQEWERGEQRIPVEGLVFDDPSGQYLPALFYRDAPELEPFLTPEKQKNWEYLKKQRAGGGDDDAPPITLRPTFGSSYGGARDLGTSPDGTDSKLGTSAPVRKRSTFFGGDDD